MQQTFLQLVDIKNDQWLIQIPAGAWHWIAMVRALPGRKWLRDEKLWQVPDSAAARTFLLAHQLIQEDQLIAPLPKTSAPPELLLPDTHRLNTEQQHALDSMEEQLILRRYSQATCKQYVGHLRQFFRHFATVHPTEITKHQIEQYLVKLVKQQHIAVNTQNQIINAIKFYYEKVLGLPRQYYELVRPKKEHRQPNVLSIAEVRQILAKTANLKHRCALTLAYASGLRISEVVHLRVADVNFEQRTLFIYDSKGHKDRLVVLSDEARIVLEQYLAQYKPHYWLFEGVAGEQYSARSLQAVFHRSKKAANANPYATFHSLRHSFATHCIQAGYSTAVVKELLGHNSIKTTERYLHVAQHALKNFRSPLDLWQKQDNFEPPS